MVKFLINYTNISLFGGAIEQKQKFKEGDLVLCKINGSTYNAMIYSLGKEDKVTIIVDYGNGTLDIKTEDILKSLSNISAWRVLNPIFTKYDWMEEEFKSFFKDKNIDIDKPTNSQNIKVGDVIREINDNENKGLGVVKEINDKNLSFSCFFVGYNGDIGSVNFENAEKVNMDPIKVIKELPEWQKEHLEFTNQLLLNYYEESQRPMPTPTPTNEIENEISNLITPHYHIINTSGPIPYENQSFIPVGNVSVPIHTNNTN